MNPAKFPKRVISYVFDMVLSFIISLALIILGSIFLDGFANLGIFYIVLIFFGLLWFVYTFIFTFWLFLSNGRSLGMLIFGLRVVHKDVSRLSFGDSLARCASEGMLVFIIIDLFYVLINNSERTAFDRISNTYVVDWRHRSN